MTPWLDNLGASLFKPFRDGGARGLFLGAFGKHPGWDDHIEDFGLESEPLLAARQLLYVQGIGGVIDSAAWDNLSPEEVLSDFSHVLFWFSDQDLLVGRMWSSRDRKGRSRYPMIVCAHAAHLQSEPALRCILPELESVESACRQATTAEEVRTVLVKARERLRSALLPESAGSDGAGRTSHAQAAALLNLSTTSEEWFRIQYALESQMVAYGPGKIPEALKRISMKMTGLPALPQQLRLPTNEQKIVEVVLFWRDFISHVVGAKIPLLFIQPSFQPWIDLIVGAPSAKQLFCLKASEKALPPVHHVPYYLPDGFRERAAKSFQLFCAAT